MEQKNRRTLRRAQVIHKTGLSQASIFRLERAGDFPCPLPADAALRRLVRG